MPGISALVNIHGPFKNNGLFLQPRGHEKADDLLDLLRAAKHGKDIGVMFLVYVLKGRKADLQAHAATRDESLNGFVNRAIDETVERDNNA